MNATQPARAIWREYFAERVVFTVIISLLPLFVHSAFGAYIYLLAK